LTDIGYEVVLLSKEKNSINMKYLYSDNKNVEIVFFPDVLNTLLQSDPQHEEFVKKYAKENNLEILKLGYEKVGKTPFYIAFYKQLQFDYKISYEKFYTPIDQHKEEELYKHFNKIYNVDYENFNIIHNQHSSGNIELKKIPKKNNIFVDKDTDPFNNMFLFRNLIKNAKEIHCINSSFSHLVDRIPTSANLYYHDVIGSRLKFKQNWNIVDKS
jgi:hypothetical protein